MRRCLALFLVLFGSPAFAQVQSRPTDAPLVTAERDAWYLRGDPVQFAGNSYYRAGAAVFFDGNRMVRTGHFNGVPLYADTTIEPFSMVFVPIGRGLLQPYELPRSGDLAGTTGSHAPSFPVSAVPSGWSLPMAPSAPTSLTAEPLQEPEPSTAGLRGVTSVRVRDLGTEDEGELVITPVPQAPLRPADVQAVRERVWVEYHGQKWVSAGPAIPFEGSGLVQTGEQAGFPVFTRDSSPDQIYLPALPGLVTPYQRKR